MKRDNNGSINQTLKPLVVIASIYFRQSNSSGDRILIDLVHKSVPVAIASENSFILNVEIETTTWGQQQLAENTDVLVNCQIQVFMKPLSPMTHQQFWKSLVSTVLIHNRKNYTLSFAPVKIVSGLYSFQLLLLTSGLRSRPILFEMSPIIMR